MPLHVTCPNCRFPYVLGDEFAGQVFTCTACDTEFPLPSAAVAASQPARLPPAEVTPQYQHVVGDRHSVALDVVGIPTAIGLHGAELGALQSFWSFRHLFLLVGILGATLVCISSPEMATRSAPALFAAAIFCTFLSYSLAIHKATLIEGKRAGPRIRKLDRYIINPIVLVVGDPGEAVGALRSIFFAFCLLSSALVAGVRAGSLSCLLPTFPQRVREASAASAAPAGAPLKTVTLFPDADQPAGEAASPAAAPSTDTAADPSHKPQADAPQAASAAAACPSTPPPPPDE